MNRDDPTLTAGRLAGEQYAQWRPRAHRIAPLIDGVDYYDAVREALIGAREQVMVVGWDIHSEIQLLRGEAARQAERESHWPIRLADLLLSITEARPALRIYLLIWVGASLFGLERQHLPRMKRPWAEHPRINLVWDRDTPDLASHHQKIFVVDDRVAFAGGMDLTRSRWDDHGHEPGDPRRRGPGLLPVHGAPYHDAMLAVDGEAARTLGNWCRERWRRATGDRPPRPAWNTPGPDPWPQKLKPLLRERDVAMVLTQPDYGGRPEKRQIEKSLVAQIEAARNLIYIETQYLVAEVLADALCAALAQSNGPEVVLILPYGCPGMLQSISMDPPRDALLERLRAVDADGRFAAYWATRAGSQPDDVYGESVYIHAKVMVIDDELLRIGSANFNNRSMGLDTELDLFFGAGYAPDREALARFRHRLISYLLDVDVDRMADEESRRGSMIAAIEHLRAGTKTLHPFDHRADDVKHALPLPIELADPGRPLSEEDASIVLQTLRAGTAMRDKLRYGIGWTMGLLRRHRGGATLLLLAIAIAVLWTATPLPSMTDGDRLRALLDGLSDSPAGALAAVVLFVVMAAAGFPVTVLIFVIGAAFSVIKAILVCLAGVLGAGAIGYAIGRLAPGALGRLVPKRNRSAVMDRIRDRGVLSVALLRNIPIAPFAIINAACGLAAIPSGRFLLGTLIGMAPGIILVAVFGNEIGEVLRNPSIGGGARVLGVAATIIGAAVLADRVLQRERSGHKSDDG